MGKGVKNLRQKRSASIKCLFFGIIPASRGMPCPYRVGIMKKIPDSQSSGTDKPTAGWTCAAGITPNAFRTAEAAG